MRPRDIKFSQSSISGSFSRKISLKQTFQQLMDGEVTPETMEVMKVVFLNGEFWALTGNRRLFLFKHLEEMGVIQSIPVEVKDLSDKGVDREFRLRHTTENGGISVKIRKAEVRDELLPFINAAKRGNHFLVEHQKPVNLKQILYRNRPIIITA